MTPFQRAVLSEHPFLSGMPEKLRLPYISTFGLPALTKTGAGFISTKRALRQAYERFEHAQNTGQLAPSPTTDQP